jgi:hypothetical protein
MKARKNATIKKLAKEVKQAMRQCPPTTDGISWHRSGNGEELDAAIRETERATRLRGRR